MVTPAEQHTAVLAALTELENFARAAGDEAWSSESELDDDEPTSDEGCVYRADGSILVYPEGAVTLAQARHIAAHSPAAVLEALAGRRRILERHAPELCSSCAPRLPPHIPTPHYVDSATGRHYWPSDDYRDAAAGLGVELPA